MGCGTKRASRLAAAIKLALHESVEVDEFADFLAARPKEANFVEEYRAAAAPKRAKNAPGSEASLEDDLPTSSQAEGHSVPKKIEEFKIVAANDTLSKQWQEVLEKAERSSTTLKRSLTVQIGKSGATVIKITIPGRELIPDQQVRRGNVVSCDITSSAGGNTGEPLHCAVG